MQNCEETYLIARKVGSSVFGQQFGDEDHDPDDRNQEQRDVYIVDEESGHACSLESPVQGI